LSLDDEHGLGVLAIATQDKFVDEDIEQVLQFFLVVCTVDDVPFNLTLADDFGLGTEFEAKEFGNVDFETTEVVGYFGHVGDDGFDAVAFALDLGLDGVHFVAVEDIVDVPADIERSHDD
jgi:hypothetical protein